MSTTKSNEWYTPSKYIEAARSVMGGIDLDPASCELANQVVKAARFYTKEENGLAQPWTGRVWLNPPYGLVRAGTNQGRSSIGHFVRKLVVAYEEGEVSQAVLLTTCRTDASYFPLLWHYAVCFTDHKIGFYGSETKRILQEQSHPLGTIFVYLGPNTQAFMNIFSHFGPIVKAVAFPPQPDYRQLELIF